MAEIYDTDRFGELYYSSREPDPDHLFLAAKYVARTCTHATIPFAFIGGWTLRLRGGTRETQDVDITVSATVEQFKQTVLQKSRYGCTLVCEENSLYRCTAYKRTSHDQGASSFIVTEA